MAIKKELRKYLILLFFISLTLNVFIISSQETSSFNVCCEKTKSGAWCQNTLEDNCDPGYRKTPTSCEATSFCKLGCCFDSDEGVCMENTPERVCDVSGGTWSDNPSCNIAQCSLGCCVLGDQASFVTLTRCKKLSALYGLETDFRKDIRDEVSCILTANFQDKGACVYESDGQKTCKFTTRSECTNSIQVNNTQKNIEFFKDHLCSDDELATNCGPTTETICIPGNNEVYFKDTCGNPANIYDSSKVYSKDPNYWKMIVPKSNTCGTNSANGNINSKDCGNCDYFKGSICADGDATYGNFICKDLNCYGTSNGNDYKNGESWCVLQGESGNGKDTPGSRHFRHICINGEEVIEPCADLRNEICIDDSISSSDGEFTEAACLINRWEDCINQDNEEDCLNKDRRDCYWSEDKLHFAVSGGKADLSGQSNNGTQGVQIGGAACLPDIPPGIKFSTEDQSNQVCSLGNAKIEVTIEKRLIGGEKCKTNCEALTPEWVGRMNNLCNSLGDCGSKENVIGRFTNKGMEWKIDGIKQKINEGILKSLRPDN